MPRPSSAGAGQNGAEAEGEASDGNEKELLSGPPSHSRVARLKRGKRRSKKWKDEYSPNQEESIAGDSIMESKETGSLVADAEEKDPAILADES